MADHRFKIGQSLTFVPHRTSHGAGAGSSSGSCKVIRLLSTESGDPQYRIKCTAETFERVVRESELVLRA